MEIIKYSDNFITMFTVGIEKEYKGTSIIYENTTKTLIYYYYPHHTRLYIIDGKSEEWGLPQVKEKVRVVDILYDREVYWFKRYMKSIIKNKKIFYLSDGFFHELLVLLKYKKTTFFDILKLYRRYTANENDKYNR